MRISNVCIKDICSIRSGKRLPKGSDFFDGITPYPYIRARDIKNGRINDEELVYLSAEVHEKIKQYIVNTNDVVITIVGASVGDVAIVPQKLDGYNLTENAVRLTDFSSDVNPKYILYVLNTKKYWEIMQQIAGGSAQPKLGIYKIESIQISLPDIRVQDKIVDILSTYDELIENNQKQIKLLEEAAQRLYKEWFIDLRFPGYETTPVHDGVPEGWERKALGEIADIIMGQSPKSEYYNTGNKGLPFHQGVGSYGNRFVIDDLYSTSYTRIANAGSILFSVRAPVGRLNITRNKIVIGRGIAALNQKEDLQSLLFYMLKERFFKDNLVGNGSIFASISKDELLGQSFIVPAASIARQYDEIASTIDKKIDAVDKEIIKLTEARDRLLPKLMSGEIEVL